MSVSVTLNGTSYPIPQTSETNWGNAVTSWIQAVSNHCLQKTGGTFTLTADVDFGTSFGLKTQYIKTQTANLASAGVLRLARADQICWRDNANSADLELGVNASDQLTWNGNPIVGSSALTASRALRSSAAGLIEASSVTSTELGYVSGVTSALQTQLDGKITAGAAAIVNADVNAAAAIARTKLASGTASHVLINDGDGVMTSEATLAKSRGGSGQDNSSLTFPSSGTIATDPLTTKGDLIVRNDTIPTRLPVGTDGQALVCDSAQALGVKWGAAPTSNLSVASKSSAYTLTAADDFINADASSAAFTLTLPSAASNSGKIFTIRKSDSTFNAVTIGSTTGIHTQGEVVKLTSDGSDWLVLDRYIPEAWTSYTPTYTGFGTVSTATAYWKRDKTDLLLRFRFTTGTNTNVEARISLPSGLTSSSAIATLEKCGDGAQAGTGGDNFSLLIEPSVAYATFGVGWTSAAEFSKQNASASFANSRAHSFTARIPIQGWNG